MLCQWPDGRTESVSGTSCPAGSVPYNSAVAAPGGAGTPGVSYIPYQADLAPVTTDFRIDGGYRQGTSSVYGQAEAFKVMRLRDPQAYRDIVDQMRRAGLIGERVTSFNTIASVYEQLLEASAQSTAQGQPQTAGQILSSLTSGGGAGVETGGGSGVGGGGYAGPRETVEIINETEAYSLINDMARDMLGRDLTEQEVKKYTQKLRQKEMASPRVSTPQGPGGTVYSGGIDRNEVVRQLLTDNPDYAGYQLNHEIMDVMLADIDEGQAFLNEWS